MFHQFEIMDLWLLQVICNNHQKKTQRNTHTHIYVYVSVCVRMYQLCMNMVAVQYLGIGWEVGTTGTNLGQLAICSCTLEQEAMWLLIFTRATWRHAHTWGYDCILYMCVESQWHCMEGGLSLLFTSIHLTLTLRLSSVFIVTFISNIISSDTFVSFFSFTVEFAQTAKD